MGIILLENQTTNPIKFIKSIHIMKQLLRFKTLLLMAVFGLLAGTNAWAQSDFSTTETSNVTLTPGTNGSSCTVNSEEGIKVGTSSKGGSMSVTVPAGTTHLHVHAAAWKGVNGLSLDITGATVSPTSISLTADPGISNNSPFTLSGSASDFYFVIELSDVIEETTLTFTTSTTKRFVIWGVNAEEVSSGSNQQDSDLALENAPVALSFDLYNNYQAQTISYTTSSTGAVTVSSNAAASFYVDEDNQTITVTPMAVTSSTQTITVNQTADANYYAGSVTFTIDVDDSTPIVSHTATFSVNGTTTTAEFNEGADIVFPANPAAVEDKQFVGWVTDEINGVTDEAPNFVTSATMGSSDVTYYAVFATISGSAAVTDVLNRDLTGVTNTSYATWTDKTSNSSAVYAGNSAGGNESIQLRSNNNNSGIVTTASGGNVSKIVVDWNANTNAARVLSIYGKNTAYESAADLYNSSNQGTLLGELGTSDTVLTVTGDYAYIGIRSKSGALYLTEVTVTWGGSGSASAYCTTVEADTRADAELAFSAATAEAVVGEEFTAPTLSTAAGFNGTVEYESSNTDVAYLSDIETGELRVVGEGTTIITATFAGNNDFKAGSASYTLTVTDNRIETTMSFAQPAVVLDVNDVATFIGQLPVVSAGETTVDYEVNEMMGDVYFETDPDFFSQSVISDMNNNSGSLNLSGALGTVTIKVTYRGSDTYKPCEGSYTITVEEILANIAAFKAIDDNATATFTLTNAQVLYNHNNGTRLYIRDGSGALLLYNSSLNYEANKMLNGTVTATKTTYRGQIETTGTADATNVTVTDAVSAAVPVSATVADVTSDYDTYDADLVKFSSVSVSGNTMTDATSGSLTIYQSTLETSFTFEDGKTYDITALVGIYNSTIQVYPISVEDVTPAGTVLAPNFDTAAGEVEESTVVTITSEDGTVIAYTTDGSDPLTSQTTVMTQGNTATVTIDADMTIRAVATDGNNFSAEATAAYTLRDATLVLATFAFNNSDWRTAHNISNTSSLSEVVEGNVTLHGSKGTGSTYPAYYDNGTNGRVYNGGLLTIFTNNGNPLTKIEFTYTSNYANLSLADGQPGTFSDGVWTASAADNVVSVTFQNVSGSQARFTAVDVTTKSDITVTEEVTISAAGFGTLFTEQPFEVPAGMTAGVISATSGADADGIATLTIDWAYTEGTVVPAATPLIIKGAQGNYEYTCMGTIADAPESNLLQGSATATTTTGGDKYFMLSYGKGDKADVLGFFYGAPEGAAFESAAGKCWLATSSSAGIRGFVFDFGTVTGISAVNAAIAGGQAVYDLQGRRVSSASKGVFIIGGKKVLVK